MAAKGLSLVVEAYVDTNVASRSNVWHGVGAGAFHAISPLVFGGEG